MKGLALALALLAGQAEGACRQALALGLDISGSVDAAEYRMQLDGLAAALGSEAVRAALLSMPDTPVEIAVFEWSGPGDRRLTVPWARVTDGAAIDRIVGALRGAARPRAAASTAIGSAMRAGRDLLAGRDCWRHVLDLSGDGPSNTGPRPRQARGEMGAVEVNALVILPEGEARGDRLTAYFRAEVIHGPEAFAEEAQGFDDYAAAMERKLLRELRALVLGADQ